MWFTCDDRTGFPLIRMPDAGLEVQLLPVTKVQFEHLLAEPNDLGDTWYEKILSLNPRVSYQRFTADGRERLFITGILPEEALAFARWMGEGFDLPTVKEWRAIYVRLGEAGLAPSHNLLPQGAARTVVERLLTQLQPCSLLDLSLMRGGVVEWVRQDDEWVGLGRPRPEFHDHLWNPLSKGEELRPTQPGKRGRLFGLRLVRRDRE